MKARTRRDAASGGPVDRGWRIEQIPSRPVRQLDEERFGLPLWLVRNGEHAADLELRMSVAEAEQLHAALCYVLNGQPAPLDAPDCRLNERQRARKQGLL